MTAVVKQFPDRSTFYKQQDANFFPTWTFVAGRSIAAVPNALIDAVFYGTMIYFLVGLAVDEGKWPCIFSALLVNGLQSNLASKSLSRRFHCELFRFHASTLCFFSDCWLVFRYILECCANPFNSSSLHVDCCRYVHYF